MTNNRQERENKELVLLSQIESKMDCLTKDFYVGVSLSEDIPWGFGNIWTTLNYLFNKKITKQIDLNQFMNVWQDLNREKYFSSLRASLPNDCIFLMREYIAD